MVKLKSVWFSTYFCDINHVVNQKVSEFENSENLCEPLTPANGIFGRGDEKASKIAHSG